MEFNKKEYDIIDAYCKEKGIEWFASSWDIDSQLFLRNYHLKHNKIASAMLTNTELLNLVAEEKKHTFISTGMSTIDQIDQAVKVFKNNNCPFELMHSNSSYPMKQDEANLQCIKTLKEKFNCDVGYSGHESSGYNISLAAAVLGATSIERHITTARAMYGSDQASSVEPSGFRMLVGAVRKIGDAMGEGKLGYIEKEIPIAENLRQHLPWEVNK